MFTLLDDRQISGSDYEDEIEDSNDKPGLFLRLNKDDSNLMPVDLSFDVSNFSGLSGYKIWLGCDGGLKLWRDAQKSPLSDIATQIDAGYDQWYTIDVDDIPETVYVEATGTGEDLNIYLRLVKPDGCGYVEKDIVARDTVKVMAYDFQYVRMFDQNKIPNRVTRAVNENERAQMMYEDNPRSDWDQESLPRLVMGAYGSQMTYGYLTIEAKYEPAALGKYILWNADANNGCSIFGATSGDYESGNFITHQMVPSTATNAEHPITRGDFIFHFGLDINDDGILQHEENNFPAFEVRLIGKKEYDYCKEQLSGPFYFFGAPFVPDAAEFLAIFMDRNWVAGYNRTSTFIQNYGHDYSHQQSNSIGFDESVNLHQGQATLFL